MSHSADGVNRRDFLRASAAATAGAAFVFGREAQAQEGLTPVSQKAPAEDGLIHGHEAPGMTYQKLGRTNYNASRLVFGCGAALTGGKATNLLEKAYEAGVNFYDIGTNSFYRGSEQEFAPFLKAHRDSIWISSKAPLRLIRDREYGQLLTAEQGKLVADTWTKMLEASLKDLDTDYMDAYYLMMVDDPGVVKCEQLYEAFQKAKQAGKVGHYGLSTHKRADDVLEAAIETGWFDLAMIAITPAGWYEFEDRGIRANSPSLTELQPIFTRAREAGIGLVGMKSARYLSGGDEVVNAFDKYYTDAQIQGALNPFQRTYAYVLRHGIDVVNSDMQNFEHFEQNVAAVKQAEMYFA
jgi:aryl-alcohol dehydrogenase-like predicted oxidoreductase